MAKKRRRRKSVQAQRRMILLSILGVVAVILIGVVIYATSVKRYVNKADTDKIYQNIRIDAVDVSGMTGEQALEALRVKEEEYQTHTVLLEIDGESVETTYGDLGLSMKNADQMVEEALSYAKSGGVFHRYQAMKELDKEGKNLEVQYGVDQEKMTAVIDEKVRPLEKKATDASITRQDGKFVITDEVTGKTVDLEASIQAIVTFFEGDWKNQEAKITLVSQTDEPEITRADLETITDRLGTYTTYCGSGGGRVQNIVSGTKHINGALIMPGEEYSANAAMEPYTTENGFTNAGSYENGKVVQSMGGGICQVSSTLYNALILAEIEITERAPHSMMVGYVDPSMDAAIAGTWKDLKFKNNTEHPIYIEGYVSGGNLTFSVYGKETRSADRTVEFKSEVISKTEPEKKFVATNSGTFGTITRTDAGHTGMKAKLWKIVKENGKEVSRDVFNTSSYMASEATYSVSIKTDNKEAKSLVQKAIESNDETKIKDAIQKAKKIISDAKKETIDLPADPDAPVISSGSNTEGE